MTTQELEFTKEDPDVLYVAKGVEQYKKWGLPTRMGFGKRAAVINLDIQNAFTSSDCPLGGGMDSMVENTAILLKEARTKKIPIFYTVVAYLEREDGVDDTFAYKDKQGLLRSWAKVGTKWVEVDERIKPEKDDVVIQKKAPSGFFMTNLIHMLVKKGVDTVIITGNSTSGCVRATVVDSTSYGFRTIIPEECVADRAPGPHKANLFDMSMKSADVIRMQEVIDYFRSLPE